MYTDIVGESATMDSSRKVTWLEMRVQVIFDRYEEQDVYNDDETGLLYQMLPMGKHCAKIALMVNTERCN